MTELEKLYETLGELIYVVAIADGVIQEEEESALKELLENHPWSEQISWSFNYEKSKATPIEDAYKKVISFCKHHGPSAHYVEFIDAMKVIAQSSAGIDQNESGVIKSFSADLISKFQRDLDIKG